MTKNKPPINIITITTTINMLPNKLSLGSLKPDKSNGVPTKKSIIPLPSVGFFRAGLWLGSLCPSPTTS